MAKNRNNKKKNGLASMAVDTPSPDQSTRDDAQAMDTSETVVSAVSGGESLRKMKRGGRPMKRSKNVRKMKAMAKAISLGEKSDLKILKSESKTLRTKTAKNLYD